MTRAERILRLSKDQENGKWGEGDKETHQQDSLVPPSGHSDVCTRHTKRGTGKESEESGRRRRVVETDLAADQPCRQQGCFLCSTGKEREINPTAQQWCPVLEEHVRHVIEKDRKLSISVRRVTQPSEDRAHIRRGNPTEERLYQTPDNVPSRRRQRPRNLQVSSPENIQ